MDSDWGPLRKDPVVSVVIPTYNCRAFLAETLDSVLAQDYPHIEVLVVDDGSTDGSAELAASYPEPVRVIRHPETGRGAGATRNLGLRESSGDLIAFVDGDDVWLPGKLSAQVDCLRHRPDVAMVAANYFLWYPHPNGSWQSPEAYISDSERIDPNALDPALSGWIYHALLLDTCVWTGTVVMRRSLTEKLGAFREDLRLAQDYEYWLRASRFTPILTLARPYALYRRHSMSATRRWAPVNYALTVLDTAVATWGLSSPDGSTITPEQLRNRRFELNFTMGYNLFWSGARSAAASSFIAAWRHRPLHWRTAAYASLASIYRCGEWLGMGMRGSR